MANIINNNINLIKFNGINWIKNILKKKQTNTRPGSIIYLLYGEKPSEQSIVIKLGKFGEYLSKELINQSPYLELLTCGVQNVNNKKKDIDLIFKCKNNKTIYYRELKANIELDTEKLPATINKCNEIKLELQNIYSDYIIDCAILNWSIYNRSILTTGLCKIKVFEDNEIKIEHMSEFLNLCSIEWHENDYYNYFRELGKIIREN